MKQEIEKIETLEDLDKAVQEIPQEWEMAVMVDVAIFGLRLVFWEPKVEKPTTRHLLIPFTLCDELAKLHPRFWEEFRKAREQMNLAWKKVAYAVSGIRKKHETQPTDHS